MAGRVFISGAGIVSALGIGKDASFDALKHGRTGIGPIRILATNYQDILPAGEIQYTDAELQQLCGIATSDHQYSRTTLLGLLAASEALTQAGGNIEKLRTGFISANSVGGMGRTEQFYQHYMDGLPLDINMVATHDCGDSTERIAHQLGTTDFVTTISTACSSSANSIMLGARMIKAGILDRAIAGGADALTKFTINGFNSLQILDHELCKPFDQNRRGLNLGEGAGYIVLESEEVAMQHSKRIIGELIGYANANDAFHQTASSPEGRGAYLAMSKALAVAKLDPSAIDYVNAHGTGTENNDITEGLAMERIFNNNVPDFSTTKPFTGHTLAAAGGIEAVISLLAIQHGLVFPSLHIKEDMHDLKRAPVQVIKQKNIKHVLSNSFGFGGNCSSLIISKFQQP